MKSASALVFGILLSLGAAAQEYPSKPVRIINPFAPGGPVDLLARAVGQKLQEAWGQPVLVETRAGAAGNIGIEYVARQPADGYTLLVMPTGNAVVNPHIFPKLPYDPLRDFAPVTLLATVENVLVVHPEVKAASVQELIALARANPGKLTFSSPGVGSQAHVAGEMLKSMAGVQMLHVPYKGMAPAMNDLLGGQVSFMFLSMSSALKQVQAGKLRALGVASRSRSSAAPDLPTVAEQGLPDFEALSWYALMAPAGAPAGLIDKIAGDAARALRAPDVRERLLGLGANPVGNTPTELAQMLKREHAFWGEFIRKAGIRGE
jgi:tripartite-type tricarboxylate transporter receptor subunit TctC